MGVPVLCPLCRGSLATGQDRWVCPAGHSFDVARQGYVNLFRPGRRYRAGGDSGAMLRARKAFLNGGAYRPIAWALAAAAADVLAELHRPVLLDAGCGEGYYTAQVIRQQATAPSDIIAFDRSRDGVRMTARRLRQGRFFVADIWEPWLLPDGAVHVLLNVFAPRNAAEMARVLHPAGRLLSIIPAPDHLLNLRQRYGLLGVEEEKEEKVLAAMAGAGLRLLDRTGIAGEAELNDGQLLNLLSMLPRSEPQILGARPELTTIRYSVRLLQFSRDDG